MIILVEGARGSGKSHLVNNFFVRNEDLKIDKPEYKNILYYKFALSDWIKRLKIEDHETGPGVHYFSIANIITILGISQTFLRDKHVVFDRSIYTAYVWSAIFRRRMHEERLMEEFEAYLSSDDYRNVAVIDVLKGNEGIERTKDDIFDKFENYNAERAAFDKVFERMGQKYMVDASKNNSAYSIINTFDIESELRFNELLYKIIDK